MRVRPGGATRLRDRADDGNHSGYALTLLAVPARRPGSVLRHAFGAVST
jgi:hypothetical protein